MADIHVQAKKHQSSPTTWIWIVAVVLIAAAVIYFLITRNNIEENKPNQTNTTSGIELPQQLTHSTYLISAAA